MANRQDALLLGRIDAIEDPRGVAQGRGLGGRAGECEELIDQRSDLVFSAAAQREAEGIGLGAVIPTAQRDEDAINHPARRWRGEARATHTFGGSLTLVRSVRKGS